MPLSETLKKIIKLVRKRNPLSPTPDRWSRTQIEELRRQAHAELERSANEPLSEKVRLDVATLDGRHGPHFGTYTPPAPYRLFRVIEGGARHSEHSPAVVGDGGTTSTVPESPHEAKTR